MRSPVKLLLYTLAITLLFVLPTYFLRLDFLFSLPKVVNEKLVSFKHAIDTNIVLVNAGNANRGEIAQMLATISKSQPRVIAINFCFNTSKKTLHDSSLIASLNQIQNLVLYRRDSLCEFVQNAHYGGTSFLEQTLFSNSFIVDSASFEFKTTKSFDKTKVQNLSEKQNEIELINFIGNIQDAYMAVDREQVLSESFDPEIFKDKLVLIGYLGEYLSLEPQDLNDTYYTPLGGNKVAPDMYGTVLIANILSTFLSGSFIEELSGLWSWAIILLLILINSLAGYFILKKSRLAYLFFSIFIFTMEILASGFFIIYLFKEYNFMLYLEKLPMTLFISIVALYIINHTLTAKESVIGDK